MILEALEDRVVLAPATPWTITVNSTGDEGTFSSNPSTLSLREAIDLVDNHPSYSSLSAAAHAEPGCNTIRRPRSTRSCSILSVFASQKLTITLVGGVQLPTITSGTWRSPGPGANLLAFDGNRLSRVFEIAKGVSAGISGLTIQDGYNLYGGGILNKGVLTLTDSTVSGSRSGSSTAAASTMHLMHPCF